jgi:hypothetical protein
LFVPVSQTPLQHWVSSEQKPVSRQQYPRPVSQVP